MRRDGLLDKVNRHRRISIERSRWATRSMPDVGRSSPPRRYSKVDFPHPAGPDDRNRLPLRDVEVDVVDSADQRRAPTVVLVQIPSQQYRRCQLHGHRPRLEFRSEWTFAVARRGRLEWLHPRRLVCVVDVL